MKLAALLNNRFSEVESRKKLVRTKSADEAYKKHAKYFSPTPNPAVEELMDLLTGKKDRAEQTNVKRSIENMKQQDSGVVKNETEVELRPIEAMRQQTPVEMMLQQPITAHILPETAMPERPAVTLKNAKQMLNERLTEKAIATYKFQMSMARDGFKVLQPLIYQTA